MKTFVEYLVEMSGSENAGNKTIRGLYDLLVSTSKISNDGENFAQNPDNSDMYSILSNREVLSKLKLFGFKLGDEVINDSYHKFAYGQYDPDTLNRNYGANGINVENGTVGFIAEYKSEDDSTSKNVFVFQLNDLEPNGEKYKMSKVWDNGQLIYDYTNKTFINSEIFKKHIGNLNKIVRPETVK